MDYITESYVLERIIVYLKVIDLNALMAVCRKIRNIVGQSDVWKEMILYETYYFGLPDSIDVNGMFRMFLSIKLTVKDFADRDYYGKWYRIFVMKTWLGEVDSNYWNIYSLINNRQDIIKIYQLCGLVLEPEYFNKYLTLITIFNYITPLISTITHRDRDKILQKIYIDVYFYNASSDRRIIYIFREKLRYSIKSNGVWSIIPELLSDKNIVCKIIFESFSAECYIHGIGHNSRKYTPGEFVKDINRICEGLGVDYMTFMKIIRILFCQEDKIHNMAFNDFIKDFIRDQ